MTRKTRSSQVTGTHRQLTCHRSAMACRVVGRLERQERRGRFASQVLEFLCRRGRQFDRMNTRSCDITHLMLTISSSCCVASCTDGFARHMDLATVRCTLYACASLNLRFEPFLVMSSMVFIWRWGYPMCCSTIYISVWAYT